MVVEAQGNISSQELNDENSGSPIIHIFLLTVDPDVNSSPKGRHLHRHLGFFEPVDFVRFTRGALVCFPGMG